jgi:hypothetical protein
VGASVTVMGSRVVLVAVVGVGVTCAEVVPSPHICHFCMILVSHFFSPFGSCIQLPSNEPSSQEQHSRSSC